MAADNIGGLPCGWLINSKDGSPMKQPPHPVLATGRVRHVGDPVAVVIAESLGQARDAAETHRYRLRCRTGRGRSGRGAETRRAASLARAGAGQCLLRLVARGSGPRSMPRLPGPPGSSSSTSFNNRLVPNAMEPRAAIGEFDRATSEHILYTTSQNPHVSAC